MNILLYSNAFLPNLGGLERNTATLARTLSNQGHTVTVLTETLSTSSADAYPYHVIRSRSISLWISAVRKCDMVIINGGLAARLIMIVLWHAKPYGIIYQTLCGYRREGKGVLSRANNLLRKYLADSAVFSVFTSEYSRTQSLIRSSKTYTVLNPIDDSMLDLVPSKITVGAAPTPIILFAGRIIEGKGVFTLAEALKLLDGRIRAKAQFVGDGPAVTALEEALRTLTTIEPVFAGRLDGAELMRAYREARVLVVPSTTHQEGNPLVIAEALSLGTPVIASNQPPMIESVGDAGATFPSGDAKHLANHIERMLLDDLYFNACQKAALNRRSLFSESVYRSSMTHILDMAMVSAPEGEAE